MRIQFNQLRRHLLLLGLLLATCMLGIAITTADQWSQVLPPAVVMIDRVSVKGDTSGEYSFRIHLDGNDRAGSFELWRNGQQAYAERGELYCLMSFSAKDDVADVSAEKPEVTGIIEGHDITGDGIRDVVLVEHHFGTCCGPTYTILSLGERVKKRATIQDYPRGGEFRFRDIDGDGVFEAEGYDSVHTRDEGGSTGLSPIPVILTYRDGAYSLAVSLMKRSPPNYSDFIARVESEKSQMRRRGYFPSSAQDYMFELTYSGNGDLAKLFAASVLWDESEGEKEFFWYRYKTKLAESPHWAELAAMNKWDKNLSEYADIACPY